MKDIAERKYELTKEQRKVLEKVKEWICDDGPYPFRAYHEK